MPSNLQLCHYNKARTVAALDNPRLTEFLKAQDSLYSISESSEGFLWRLTDATDESGSVRPFNDQQVLIGLSVWRDVESLRTFVYGEPHADLIRQRRKWFEPHAGPNYVLWWKRAGELPTIAEGEERLSHLRAHGPAAFAFNFQARFRHDGIAVGTLGPKGTNSEKAALEYMHRACISGDVQMFETFEDVIERLLAGNLDKAVVCTAYLKFSALYFERVPRLRMIDAFVADLHPMVIAVRPFETKVKSSVAVQPAILPLIQRYMRNVNVAPAASNASAAQDVGSGRADACLTTEVAAQDCGLDIRIRMPRLQIPFVVFERSNCNDALPEELGSFFDLTATEG